VLYNIKNDFINFTQKTVHSKITS